MGKSKSIVLLLTVLCIGGLPASGQSVCWNAKADSRAGTTTTLVYKQYKDDKGSEKDLHIDLASPADSLTIRKRPLVIGIHGGGFADKCFSAPCYLRYSDKVLKSRFLPHGFITASVEYRLSSPVEFNPFTINNDKVNAMHYRAVQDVRAAIKYIFENAEKLNVDNGNVFLIGTSAGAITALNAAYMDRKDVPNGLAKKYGKLEKREKVKGIISLSGAISDLSLLKGNKAIALMIVHGKDDIVVPFAKDSYFKFSRLSPVFGGKAIYDKAVELGIPVKAHFYDFGHSYPEESVPEIFRHANAFITSHITCPAAPMRERRIKALTP